MLAELAVFALALAFSLSLLQAFSLYEKRLLPLLSPGSSLSALLVFLAFIILILLRIDSDFTVANVAEHSNRALPLLYKIAGTWGNHEGSLLLWALVVTGFGACLAGRHPRAAAIQALLAAGVLAFILGSSNPFERIFPPPPDGKMLNPLLQDIALSLHPPMLYLGYVGFSAVFSLALAGLWERKIDRAWAEAAHPWIMFAWSALTMGIALGSWWAYRELGWGGYWFWDPVENASLMPWLAATALLHSNIVLKKRGQLARWVALLAILTFAMSLIGTFLVRSGAITSVHSFASDPARGLYILGYIALSIGGGLWLYGARAGSLAETAPLRPASREGAIVVNNLFLTTACATVLLGTLYPMIAELASGAQITVGAPYFNSVVLPILAAPLLLAALTAFLPWKKASLAQVVKRAWFAFAAALVVAMLVMAVVAQETLLAACGLGLGAFLMAGSAQWLAAGRWRMRGSWPVFLGHTGAAMIVIGITGTSLWSKQTESFAGIGDDIALAGYVLNVAGETTLDKPNYQAQRLTLHVKKNGAHVTTLAPEFRRYKIQGSATSEAAIHSTGAYDLYAVIGEKNDKGKTALRIYFKPTISFLWLGALVIASGGLLAGTISLRRRRP
ncbi:MAG: heme lyase CcmF/NrfE family subunit [Alphaproteobacteria bacterium]|nr:heme lyase CcmF/NrfE family subunit [Alphaproteobacteria bacterium]